MKTYKERGLMKILLTDKNLIDIIVQSLTYIDFQNLFCENGNSYVYVKLKIFLWPTVKTKDFIKETS